MRLKQPQLLLKKVEEHVYLIAKTHFVQVNIQAAGSKIVGINRRNMLEVELYGEVDKTLPEDVREMEIVNPILHIVPLGELLNEESIEKLAGMEVNFYTLIHETNTRDKPKKRKSGTTITTDLDSDGDTKPTPRPA